MGNDSGKQPKSTTAHPHSLGATSAPELPKDVLKQWQAHTKVNRASNRQEQSNSASQDKSKKSEQPTITQPNLVAETDDADESRAVDAIVKEEADELLASRDMQSQPTHEIVKPKRHKLRRFFAILLGLIVAALIAGLVYPTSRYIMLNTAGVRSKASVIVLDNQTRLPLKNVTVSVGSKSVKTDSSGQAVIKDLKLGRQSMTIKRVAFESITHNVTIGWGSNPLGEFLLKSTGVQYVINTRDYISGQKVQGIEARSGEAIATADNNGVITLTLEEANETTLPLTITANGYRTEQLTFRTDRQKPIEVSLVPSAKAVFAIRQDGRYDIMGMDIDGAHKEVLLAGTGSETVNTSIVPDIAGSRVAVVSHRDNLHGAQGQIVNTLSIISLTDKSTQGISKAEHIQVVGWIGSRLVFQESNTTGNADDPARYKIVAYDTEINKRTQLASSNEFNSVQIMKDQVYYATSSGSQKDDAFFYRISPDASARQTLFSQEVWSVVRTGYDTMHLQTPGGWYAYKVGGSVVQAAAPNDLTDRQYVEGPSQQSFWIQTRAGQGTLYSHDNVADKDMPITTQGGLMYPVRWLNKSAGIVRIVNGNEVTDYAVSTVNGSMKKIAAVANTYGAARQ